MNKYQLFEAVVTHLLTQNKKAQTIGRECLYRAPDGTKCAVGCLIPDDLYSESMERRDATRLPPSIKKVIGLDDEENMKLAMALQRVHDAYNIKVEDWPVALAGVGFAFGIPLPYTLEERLGHGEQRG